jgi:predicted HNH restriction endonuclease
MCNCIEKINQKLDDEDTNTRVHIALSLSGQDDTIIVSTSKKDPKVRKKPVNILPTYCPFCGVKYNARKGQS